MFVQSSCLDCGHPEKLCIVCQPCWLKRVERDGEADVMRILWADRAVRYGIELRDTGTHGRSAKAKVARKKKPVEDTHNLAIDFAIDQEEKDEVHISRVR